MSGTPGSVRNLKSITKQLSFSSANRLLQYRIKKAERSCMINFMAQQYCQLFQI